MLGTAIGDVLGGRYQIRAPLGDGGYGEVWRVLDQHRNWEVALKLLWRSRQETAWHEASVLTALRSPHVLTVNNADVFIDVPFIDTELAKADMEKLAMPRGVAPQTAVAWMRRALRGLEFCHRRGLLHRDVKPSNLFLDSSDDAKLGDFGIAALMDSDGSADPQGDPHIKAPEFYKGARATVASDVYAAAVTLYALLVGRYPFNDPTQSGLDVAITSGKYLRVRDAAPHVPGTLARIVERGLSMNPTDRFVSADSFDNQLGRLALSTRQFARQIAHPGHEACWSSNGPGTNFEVCVMPGKDDRSAQIETRRVASSRIKQHCGEVPRRQLLVRLRSIFDAIS